MEGNHLKEAIEKGILIARENERLCKKRSNTFIPAYIGSFLILIPFVLNYVLKKANSTFFEGYIAETMSQMPVTFVIALFIAVIPIINIIPTKLGMLFMKEKYRKIDQKIEQTTIQFKQQTNLNTYFLDSYTLKRFHHYLEVGIADNLKECASIFQQENLRDDIKDLKREVENMHTNINIGMDDLYDKPR